MMRKELPSYLRLAVSRDEPEPEREAARSNPEQLSFPYFEPGTVLLVDVSRIDRATFLSLLERIAPRCIIDARAVPRLDTLAGSRGQAFQLFRRSKADYIDLFGRLDITSYSTAEANPVFWSQAVASLLKQFDKSGPYLFLFDDRPMMTTANHILSDALRPVIGESVRVSIFNSSIPCD